MGFAVRAWSAGLAGLRIPALELRFESFLKNIGIFLSGHRGCMSHGQGQLDLLKLRIRLLAV